MAAHPVTAGEAHSPVRRPVLDALSQRILDLIQDRGLRPGDPMLTEVELIDALRVSRNSVREAMRSLRALGIVDTRHGHGSVVGEPSLHVLLPSLSFAATSATTLDGLRNLVEVRELLEVGVIARVAGTLDPATLKRLDELCDDMTDTELDPALDHEFHRTLYAAVGNPLIGQLIDVFWDAYRSAHAMIDPPERTDTAATVARHRRIVDALRDGEPGRAQTAMADHFADVKRRLGQH